MATSETPRFWAQIAEGVRLAGLAARLVWRASRMLMVAIVLLLAVQALLSPVELVFARMVLNRAAMDLHLAPAPDVAAAQLPLVTWIALAAAVLAIGQLSQPFAATFQSLAGDRLTGYVTGQLIRAANRWQGLARFEDPRFMDDLERSRTRAARGGLDVLVSGAQAVLALFRAISVGLLLLGLQPLVPVVMALATLPAMTRQWEYGRRTYGHLYTQTAEARRLRASREVVLQPEPAKDVRLYGLAPFFRRRYEAAYAGATATLDRLRFRLLGSMAFTGAISGLAAASAFVYLVILIAHGQRTVGDLVLYGGAITLLQSSLQGLAGDLGGLPEPLGFLPSLFGVLDAPADLPLPATPQPAPRPIHDGIVFDQVSFAYPGQDAAAPILRDLSFRLRPGECLALVGHNGAGKTTVVKLLLRLYDPTAGRILLDGVDLREYDLADLRRQLGVVFQDFVRYELSAAENIAIGQIEGLEDRDRLLAAARAAGAEPLIRQLPDGLETALGRAFGGRELSGGEWQKLALARAFVRDAQLLVLDEPTAALDVRAEYDIYRRFRELTRGRTTVLISHRFSTVRMADHILYLADGAIKEEGSHAELLARDGEYARLYRLQAAQYLAAPPVVVEA